jgi:hypothetical protein
MSPQELNFKDLITSTIQSEVTAYEIVDGNNDYVTSYSAHLKKNTNGKLDGLKLAKDAVKYKQDYKILEVYENGYRKLLEI